MKYEEFTIEELEKLTGEYIKHHWSNGGSSEFDKSINDISRAIIKKYHQKHGKCFLGSINPSTSLKNGEKATFVEYTGQLVLNFQFNFVIPCQDKELTDLLTEHQTVYDQNSFNRINAIILKIDEIGGIQLFWV